MAEKFAKWTFSGNTLSLGDKATLVRHSLDLTTVYPGFDGLPEHERFALVYGTKQWLQDHSSTVQGLAKVDSMIGDMDEATLKGLTFAKEGKRAGISYKEKLAQGMEANLKDKEKEMLKALLVKAGMGGMLK